MPVTTTMMLHLISVAVDVVVCCVRRATNKNETDNSLNKLKRLVTGRREHAHTHKHTFKRGRAECKHGQASAISVR